MNNWNPEYLCNKLKNDNIIAHVATHPNLSFLHKNFNYINYNFPDFIDKCINDSKNFYYLRTVGNIREKDATTLSKHYPAIANDVIYPEFLNFCNLNNEKCFSEESECLKRHLFSSVLRISSQNLGIWTHYDIFDNVLLQVSGEKLVNLYPPNDAPYLYLSGDKSKIEMDSPNINEEYPLYKHSTKYQCVIGPGDALVIPSMWFHNTKALDFSISINFFWRNSELEAFYDKKDFYGNKDLLPAKYAFKNIEQALTNLSKLPKKHRLFYINRIIGKLNQIV